MCSAQRLFLLQDLFDFLFSLRRSFIFHNQAAICFHKETGLFFLFVHERGLVGEMHCRVVKFLRALSLSRYCPASPAFDPSRFQFFFRTEIVILHGSLPCDVFSRKIIQAVTSYKYVFETTAKQALQSCDTLSGSRVKADPHEYQ